MVTTEIAHRVGNSDIAGTWQALGECIAKSQFMQCQNVEQGKLIAMTCLMRGMDPLTFAQSYDIIKGKISKKADRMLADFYSLGGRYKVLSRTADLASIELNFEGQVAQFSLSWEEAQQEAFTKGKDGKIKDNYSTPRIRMQMLWARVVSDGIRVVCPQVCSGIYTPEEISDIEDGEVASPPAAPVAAPVTAQVATAPAAATIPTPTVIAPAAAPAAAAPSATTRVTDAVVEDMATVHDAIEIDSLFMAIGASEASRVNAMKKRNVSRWEDLTREQAAELIANLQSKLKSDPKGPITAELEKQIRDEMLIIAQEPEGAKINEMVKAHLDIYGMLLSQLTYGQGNSLMFALKQRQVALFTQIALRDQKMTAEGNA